ncbi:ketopantoate reductase PanE/ApbA C terminal-domain-containing protein [Lipomyces kononenkoae]|uniref:Ketopantoate reductase PanE/ApbA C terminal-domain-containing protein n=1 Tax=Lipomyces kononenkoae TaxID=34357 RepID=A0ACC3TBH0_LIPKO
MRNKQIHGIISHMARHGSSASSLRSAYYRWQGKNFNKSWKQQRIDLTGPGVPKREHKVRLLKAHHDIFRRTVAVLGVGSVGGFVAWALKRSPVKARMALILRSRNQALEFYKSNSKISVNRQFGGRSFTEEAGPFRMVKFKHAQHSLIRIYNLIVCTKAQDTLNAIKRLRDRRTIDAKANIVLLQNGLGLVEDIKALWPLPEYRPNIIVGINTHGCSPGLKTFSILHRGIGSIQYAVLPRYDTEKLPVPNMDVQSLEQQRRLNYLSDTENLQTWNTKFITRVLNSSPDLGAVQVTYKELLAAQIDKMLINCCINPLTALMDVDNGEIGRSTYLMALSRMIIAEAASVLRNLPEMKIYFTEYELEELLNPIAVWKKVVAVAKNTALNVSSMRQDIRNYKITEIDFLNGFIVQEGARRKIYTPVNRVITLLVKKLGQQVRNRDKLSLAPPLEVDNSRARAKNLSVDPAIALDLKLEERSNFSLGPMSVIDKQIAEQETQLEQVMPQDAQRPEVQVESVVKETPFISPENDFHRPVNLKLKEKILRRFRRLEMRRRGLWIGSLSQPLRKVERSRPFQKIARLYDGPLRLRPYANSTIPRAANERLKRQEDEKHERIMAGLQRETDIAKILREGLNQKKSETDGMFVDRTQPDKP